MLNKPITLCGECPLYYKPYGKPTGFSIPHGEGLGGVAIVAEALGAEEEVEGLPLVGKSGYGFFQQLKRVGVERDQFTILNVCSCRPPNNKLVGEVYEDSAIQHCSPYLEKNLRDAKEAAEGRGQHFTILTLGVTAFRVVLGLPKKGSAVLAQDYFSYPMWSDRFSCWVYNVPHPAYLLRGNTHLWPIVHFTAKRALEVAANGLTLDENKSYLLDPGLPEWNSWISRMKQASSTDPNFILSYDIETPYKVKKDEQDLSKEDDADHTILRVSFCWKPGEAVSVRWGGEYLAGIEEVFTSGVRLGGWNSNNYDDPRIRVHFPTAKISSIDFMVAWHVLNSSLPKSLGFVTPFYVPDTSLWKHLSDDQPAFYSAKDADMALRNYIGVKADLISGGLWKVFERHVVELNKALSYMSMKGVLRDSAMRDEAEVRLQTLLDDIEEGMETSVPREARKLKVFKSLPKQLKGLDSTALDSLVEAGEWTQVEATGKVKRCSGCGVEKPKKAHFKPTRQPKATKKNPTPELKPENPCVNSTVSISDEPLKLWAKPLGFKISKLGLSNYQKALKHEAILSRKEKKVTFNEDAIVLLMKKHPNDPLYPKILAHREVGKILSTYVGVTTLDGKQRGGMEVGADGRIHPQFTHNPSTLRLACQSPNMQNLTRPDPTNPDALGNIVRKLVMAGEGSTLYARDYSGIEAVLTGYFAGDPGYVRLSKRDIHTFYTVHALNQLDGRVKTSDLPDISWPDEKLFPYLEQLKKEFKHERNSLYKHLVHASNFMQGAKGAAEKIFSETRVQYPVKTVQRVMDVYYSLFPSIRRLHTSLLEEAEKEGYLRNPFGYIHRFSRVYDYNKTFGEWEKRPGSDANKVVAFKAQSTAAAIIKEALMRLYFNRFQEAGQHLRLQVHDELLFEVPTDLLSSVDGVVKAEMERPIPELPLPKSWGMGENLVILTEEKMGKRWGEMR